MKYKEWNKTFWSKFPEAVGKILYEYFSREGIPPEFLLDFFIEDDKHIGKLLEIYYDTNNIADTFSKNQIEQIREYLKETRDSFESKFI